MPDGMPPLTPPVSRTDYMSIQSDIDGLDYIASQMEAKWGRGRLRLLVGSDLRQRFDDQRGKLNDAIWSNDVSGTRQHAEAMARGWKALDAAAEADGQKPLDAQVWETITPDGEVIAIAQSSTDAAAIRQDGRQMQIWTLAEIGRLIGSQPGLVGAAKMLDGELVITARTMARPEAEEGALDDIEHALYTLDDGDPLP